ncbi:MAG: methyltransferase domain-containing protein [Candidatus Omnitrophota bacterium]
MIQKTEVTIRDIFQRLLVALWLRPERALWEAHQLYIVKKFLGEFSQPSLEYGCTDGALTLVMLDGEFDFNFDNYQDVAWDKDSHLNHDMLNSDYFDSFDSTKNKGKTVAKAARGYFDYGVSWKQTHIQKSQQLDVYKNLECVNLGAPLDQFADNFFATIFAPNLFWIQADKLERSLGELARVLKPNGRIITIFPDQIQKNYIFYNFHNQDNEKWLRDLDRGMHLNLTRHACSLEQWQETFKRNKLVITKHDKFIPSLVSQVYQLGLRPMFPVFMNMYGKLKRCGQQDWMDVKRHWIDTSYHFLGPLCDCEWMEKMKMDKLWHIFELKIL